MNIMLRRASAKRGRASLTLAAVGLATSLLLAACGGDSAPQPTQAPAAAAEPTKVSAEVVAAGIAAMNKHGCYACHAIDGNAQAIGVLGPNLSRIYADATTIITRADYKSSQGRATTAEEYIRESILNTNVFIYPDCPSGPCQPGLMISTYKDSIPPAELEQIVGYLMTLGR